MNTLVPEDLAQPEDFSKLSPLNKVQNLQSRINQIPEPHKTAFFNRLKGISASIAKIHNILQMSLREIDKQ
jgi:hypothetical protein